MSPEIPAGDFSYPPPGPGGPDGGQQLRSRPTPLDPSTATPIDDATSPTKRLYRNRDGSRTLELSAGAVRYQDASGRWVGIDRTLVRSPDGSLGATSAPDAVRLAPTAQGSVASLGTPAGTVAIRHPDALAVAPTTQREQARYAKALPGGRDLTMGLIPGGVEETVTLPSAATGASYLDEILLPRGVTARQADAGIELVDADGAIVAVFDGGAAFDAAFPASMTAVTPVSVRLVAPATEGTAGAVLGNVVTVDVGVDPAWLTAADRRFPVSIDPSLHTPVDITNTNGTGPETDTYVVSGTGANTAYPNHYLGIGSTDGGVSIARSMLSFDLSGLPANDLVTDAKLRIDNWYSPACTPQSVNLYGRGSAFSASSTWNTSQPGLDANGTVSSTPFAFGAAGCPGNWQDLDATALVQRWLHGGEANRGLELRAANESTAAYAKWFYSGRSAYPPILRVTLDRFPSPSTPLTPATGTVVTTTTPTLTATAATDPDTDPVSYWFRATPAPDAESGAKMVDSGSLPSPSFTVPLGALTDGVTYYWHAWTSDGFVWRPPQGTPASFRVDLRLGAKDPYPRDAVGPAQVNLTNGNLVVGTSSPSFPAAGGSAGLSYAYNSQGTTNLGLSAQYYVDQDPVNHLVLSGQTPQMVRVDPTPDFYWGMASPGGGVPADHFLVRWTGSIKVPNTGSYVFAADHDDGIKITVGATVVLNHPAGGAVSNPSELATPINLTSGTPVSIAIDYYQNGGPSFVSMSVQGPYGDGGAVKYGQLLPSWLTPNPGVTVGDLPAGWTVGPVGLPYTGAVLGNGYVAVTGASGAAHTYRWNGSGFSPPADEDGVLAYDASGLLTLHTPDGVTYVFNSAGRLQYATDGTADDGSNAALQYLFSTDPSRPVRLIAIKDPVGNRQIDLRYGSRDACPTQPPTGLSVAPTDMLCQVVYWDVDPATNPPVRTSTALWYSSGQLAQIVDPGGATTELTYDATAGGLLSRVMTPLAWDATHPVRSGGPLYGDNARTRIGYDTAAPRRVTSVSLPEPTPGAARPGHTYDYPGTTTNVHVDGMTGVNDEPNLFARRVAMTPDLATRTTKVEDTDATNRKTTSIFDAGDRVTSVTQYDLANTPLYMSTSIHDGDAGAGGRVQPTGRVTDTYGSALASCFSGAVPNGTCSSPKPAHTATTYDTEPNGTGLPGLAATLWNGTGLGGSPVTHADALVTGGVLVAGNPAGVSANNWSGRYLGELIVPAAASYHLAMTLTGSARLFVDDAVVVDASQAHSQLTTVGATSGTLAAGRHRFRVDYAAPGGQTTPQLSLSWAPAGQADAPMAASALAPRYSNPIRTTTDDTTVNIAQRVTLTGYDTNANRLVKTQTQDPAGLNLVTSTAYGDASVFHRPISSTLPAGAATTVGYQYYGQGELPPATGCAQAPAPDQARMLKSTIGATPDRPSGRPDVPIVTTVANDAGGRPVASKAAVDANWTCLAYDLRGRVTTKTIPANLAGTTTRTITYTYAVGGDPLVSRLSETTDSVTTTTATTAVDLLGRVVSYTDTWGNTTTTSYDQAGRAITARGPTGRLDTDYDQANRPTFQYLADDPMSLFKGAQVATASYDDAGRLGSATYPTGLGNAGNGTALATDVDQSGKTKQLTWSGAGGALGNDLVRRSQSGRVVDETIDGTDANPPDPQSPTNPAGDNFFYDGAGRLTDAWVVAGHQLHYAFDADGGCGSLTTAGRNTNRTAVADNTTTLATYCYDATDRLRSSTDAAVGTVSYDAHGNVTGLGTGAGAQSLAYDGADRHVATSVNNVVTVTYTRDATDRITSRTEAGTTRRYGFAGGGDSPAVVTDTSNVVLERMIGLVGGVTLTKGPAGTVPPDVPAGDRWSYPNLHGDVMVLANAAGAKQGPTFTYDPFGQGTVPDDAAANLDYGWLGTKTRPTEHAPGVVPMIEMGARPYLPSVGRFLQVDPVAGGSANDYDYVGGDPVNAFDLSGLCNDATVHCVMGILQGTEDLPDGFAAWESRRSGGFVYYIDTRRGTRAVLSTGSCSVPVIGDNPGPFRNACKTHDLGYDIMRYFGSSGSGGSVRKAVDNGLFNDLKAVCGGLSWWRRPGCGIWSRTYYEAVHWVSQKEHYGTPH